MLEITLCKRNLVFELIGLNIQDISLSLWIAVSRR